jgi:hypothetical protein
MKGKFKLEPKNSPDKSLGGDFYAGGNSNVAKESKNKSEGFKKGGKAVKMDGDKAKMHAGRKPRMSGGKVLSSASSGTARSKSSHY